jgi:hypothetical protein
MGPSINVEYVLNEKADGEADGSPQDKLQWQVEEGYAGQILRQRKCMSATHSNMHTRRVVQVD